MVAMLAFGGTFAYFTATAGAPKTAQVTTGVVQLGENTIFTTTSEKIVSGQSIVDSTKNDKVTVTNKSDVPTYIFVKFAVKFSDSNATPKASLAECTAEGHYFLDIAGKSNDVKQLMNGQTAVTNVYYIEAPKAAAEGTSYDVCTDVKFYGWSQSTTTQVGSLMGDTITVSIESKSIQTINETGVAFADAYAAYTALGAFAD